jgi:hypothetical protein
MPDRTQIGPSVDAELWQRFRENVKERKGTVRGNLGGELENAIRQYLGDEPAPAMRRFDQRLARIEDSLGVAEADGGIDTFDAPEHTHAPTEQQSTTPDEKPAANAATEKKVQWLAVQVEDEVTEDFQEIHPAVLKNVVKECYGFRSDTAKRYIDELKDHFNLVENPDDNYPTLVTESEHDRILKEQREQRKQDAEEEIDNL